ncbi:aspartic proteinase Asp1, partial [Corchorus olitorius]
APHPLYRPNNDLVPCKDPLCAALHPPGDYKCESPDQCDYEVEYADGGSSLKLKSSLSFVDQNFEIQNPNDIPNYNSHHVDLKKTNRNH